jgi:hypothetical protein
LSWTARALFDPASKEQETAASNSARRRRRRRRNVIKFSLESNPYGLKHIFETRRIEDGNEKRVMAVSVDGLDSRAPFSSSSSFYK